MDKYRKIYVGYNDEELKKLWNEAVFVFDNNILLDLYRGSKETREFIMLALVELKDRIWMPNQVMKEFFSNRVEEIYKSVGRFKKLENDVNKLNLDLYSSLRLNIVDNYFEKEIKKLTSKLNTYKADTIIVENPRNDKILDKLIELFDNKIGNEYSESELNAIYKEGENRYIEKIPPGYEDAKKKSPDKFGDLLIWRQMIDFSKNNNKHVIFITRDQKEDWIYIVEGKRQGPKHELRLEFQNITGNMFHIYDLDQFVKLYSENKGVPIDKNIINNLELLNNEFSKSNIAKTGYVLNKSFISNWNDKINEKTNYNEFSYFNNAKIKNIILSDVRNTSTILLYLENLLMKIQIENIDISELELFHIILRTSINIETDFSDITFDERSSIFDRCMKILALINVVRANFTSNKLNSNIECSDLIYYLDSFYDYIQILAKNVSPLE